MSKKPLCAVCKSNKKNVTYLTITNCNLCEKCDNNLAKGFEEAMTIDKDEYPEL